LAVLTMGLGIQYLNRTKSSEKNTVTEALL